MARGGARQHEGGTLLVTWAGPRCRAGIADGAALGEFWYLRGYFGEGRRWLEEALAKPGRAPTAARARALQRVSWLAFLQVDFNRAEEASEEGLGVAGVEFFRTGGGTAPPPNL